MENLLANRRARVPQISTNGRARNRWRSYVANGGLESLSSYDLYEAREIDALTQMFQFSDGLFSWGFSAASASPQAGIPFRVRGIFHQVPIQVGRSVRPPDGTALAQGLLDDIDSAMRRRFLDLIARKFGGPDRVARLHQFVHEGGFFRGRKIRIGHSPEFSAGDEVPAIRRNRMLRRRLERGLALLKRPGHWIRMISASPAPA
jgi:hypothetical protein